jgi:hypothetical protein
LELLVLDDEGLHLPFRSRDFVELGQVEFAELLDVEGSTVLVRLVVEPVLPFPRQYVPSDGEEGKGGNAPRVKRQNCLPLLVLERLVQLVDLERRLPLLSVDPHELGLGEVKLAGAKEAAASSCLTRFKEGKKGGVE